jgi:hypothetical protein
MLKGVSAASHKMGFRLKIGNPKENMGFNQAELDEITRRITKCTDNVIFIPFSFETTDIGTTHSSHANMLIFRKINDGYQLEHFEPHGVAFRGKNGKKHSVEVEKWMEAFIRRLKVAFNKPVKYVSREELCPMQKGFQMLEEKFKDNKNKKTKEYGYCGPWSMFYTELCMKNPTIPGKELMALVNDKLSKMTEEQQMKYLKELVRGYSNYMKEKLLRYFDDFPYNIKLTYVDHYYDMMEYIIELELKQMDNANGFEIEREYVLRMLRQSKTNKEKQIWMNKKIILERHATRFIQMSRSISTKSKSNNKTKKKCTTGKILNPTTGRCINKCPPGKERNPSTGRCITLRQKK